MRPADEEGHVRRAVLVGIGLVVAALVGVLVYRSETDAEPVAVGRSSDACPAEGAAGLVGLDAATGEVRWTNVVGDSVSKVWAGSAPVDGETHVVVVGEDASVRTVVAKTGAVDRCPDAAKPRPEDLPVPTTIDASGATARDRMAGAVEVVEADGSRRWLADGRELLGASSGGLVVHSDTDPRGIESSPPAFSVEALEPATGAVRWQKDLPGVEAHVTDEHVIVLDQFPGLDVVPGPHTSMMAPDHVRVTAYSLADGHEAWHATIPGLAWEFHAVDGTVFVPVVGHGLELLAIDDRTGKRRWQVPLPEPGRGGTATGFYGVPGIAVADGVVVAAVQSTEPQED